MSTQNLSMMIHSKSMFELFRGFALREQIFASRVKFSRDSEMLRMLIFHLLNRQIDTSLATMRFTNNAGRYRADQVERIFFHELRYCQKYRLYIYHARDKEHYNSQAANILKE